MSLFRIIDEFNKIDIKYVVIGVSGINAYISDQSKAINTLDYDIFIKPDNSNVQKALHIMFDNGYKILSIPPMIHGLPDNEDALNKLTFNKYTIKLLDPKTDFVIELIQDIDGFTFDELYDNCIEIKINNVIFNVGHIKDLIKSKETAGRDKDYDFLDKNKLLLNEIIVNMNL